MGASRRTTGRVIAIIVAVLVIELGGYAPSVVAGPITFNTALPVGEDVFTARIQGIHRDREEDRSGGRTVEVDGVVAALGYGFTRDWTGIAIVPWLDKGLTTPGGVRRQADGIGDTTLLARYTAYERNMPGGLFRIAPIGGVVAPTGSSDESDGLGEVPRPLQPGTGGWAAIAGVIATRQTLDWQIDATLTGRVNGRHEGFEPGDEIELAASCQYRLPWPARGAPAFGYAVLETKAIHRGDDVVDGARVDNGGTEWRITPGLQYVARRWVVEAAVELPLADDMPDTALRDDEFWHIGVRFNF